MITGKNYIGYALSAKGKVSYKTFNPKLNIENAESFIEASEEEIDEAVSLASQAFVAYRNLSGKKKAKFLDAIADEILNLGDALITTYMSETGLTEDRAKGERGRTIFQLRSFAKLVEHGAWVDAIIDRKAASTASGVKPDLRRLNIPIGPIVVFGASNFPLAYSTAGGDTASALAAGCPVIVKSHPLHAGTGELVAAAIIKAAKQTNMPNGVFSNLNSSGIDVGVALVNHPKVKGVGFTGSINGGRALFNIASNRDEPIPVFAEMGSINPVVLFPEALAKRAKELAEIYASSITLGSGQFCTNPGLLLGIKGEGLTEFITTLSEEIKTVEHSCMLNPNIYEAYATKKDNVLSQHGIEVVGATETSETNYGNHVVAKVDAALFLENKNLHQEVFGPFSMVVECESLAQLTAVISSLEGQLTGTIISEDKELLAYNDVVSALQNRVGRLIFNGVPTGVEVVPAMVHGGPYPASTDSRFSAVGTTAIKRWVRPFSFQDCPDTLLPDALKNSNPLGILRSINGKQTTAPIRA